MLQKKLLCNRNTELYALKMRCGRLQLTLFAVNMFSYNLYIILNFEEKCNTVKSLSYQ